MTAEKENVLITGASFGIGKELARIFAQKGYDLILAARSRESLEELAAAIRKDSGAHVEVVPADLSEPEAAAKLYREVHALGRPVDILVNNAGSGLHGHFSAMDLGKVEAMIRLNISALTDLTHFFLPSMQERGKGKILNVASTAAFQPGPLMAVYYATKSYVLHFSEAIAEELRGSGVTVTVLCPGPTRTEFQNRAGIGKVAIFSHASMGAKSVAQIGFDGLIRGKQVVVAGLLNRFLAFSTRFMPRALSPRIVRKLQEAKN